MDPSDLNSGENYPNKMELMQESQPCAGRMNIQKQLQSIKSENIKCDLVAFSHFFNGHNSHFQKYKCVEWFIDSLISRSREELRKPVLNLGYFLCLLCGNALDDPVTLKCGHTVSKSCALNKARNGAFRCLKCNKTFDYDYLFQLKPNVVLRALTKNFWNYVSEKEGCNNSDQSTFTPHEAVNLWKSFVETLSPKGLLERGDALVNMEKYEEALQIYLFCANFDSHLIQAKKKAIEIAQCCLQKCPFLPKKCDCSNTVITTKRNLPYCDCLQLPESKAKLKLSLSLQKFCFSMGKILDQNFVESSISSFGLEKQDFDCIICMRIFLEPITTPCGHTFCRMCLYRCFDHQPACPLCKTALDNCLAERINSVDEFILLVVTKQYSAEYTTRTSVYQAEMEKLKNAGKDPDHDIPLFVCTVSYPTIRCPLHVFEPCYRLMIRQCMESGCKKFGMCAFVNNNISEYGTILEIQDVRYFPDGRAVVDTIGTKRFRVLRNQQKDGYHTGAVQYIYDEHQPDFKEIINLFKQHDRVYEIAAGWAQRLPFDTRVQIMQHFGPMPRIQANFATLPDGPSWFWWMMAILPIEAKTQVMILSMTSLYKRLAALEKILSHLDATYIS